ncbi:MAG TPA: DUF4129 domain-containing protein [Candidatus Tumulicola sp.]|nr:DUF4129 domain-containing protein [Candidatus Tumulicola sp.]
MTRHVVVAGACAAAVSLLCAPCDARNTATAGAQYAAALNRAADALEAAAKGQAHDAVVADLHVPPAPLPGPPRFSPSLDDWLQAGLRQARGEFKAKTRSLELRDLAKTLRGIGAETAQSQNAAQPKLDAAKTAAAILADPAYHIAESGTAAKPQRTLWDRFVEWLAGLVDKIFGGLYNVAAGSPLFGKVLAVVLLVTFIGLLGLMSYRLARAFLARRRRAVALDVGEALEPLPDSSSLYGLARVAARNRQYGKAVALVFRASLMLLDRAGRVPYDPARTAGEYRAEVRRRLAPAAAPFDRLAKTFTLATYAEVPVSDDDWSQAEDAFNRFEPLAERR